MNRGWTCSRALTRLSPRLAVVIITAYRQHRQRRRCDAAWCIRLPAQAVHARADPGDARAIRARAVVAEPDRRSARADRCRSARVIARKPATLRFALVLEQGRQVAATDAVVLIRGESGTGKGGLRPGHSCLEPAGAGPFVTVSCPSLSADLLESALFGHVRGSFTGAVADTEGKVAAAEGGTLFLDEIGDLPLAAPTEAAAVSPGTALRTCRREPDAQRRRPADRRIQPRPRRRRCRRPVSRRPAVSLERHRIHPSAPARSDPTGSIWPLISWLFSPARSARGSRDSRPRPIKHCSHTPGREISASCATPSNGP